MQFPMKWRWPAINEDIDAEFSYWLRELLAAVRLAAIAALAGGMVIAALPDAGAGTATDFAQKLWPQLVECAFWLGMFVGLLWGAGKRLGAALAGGLPWQDLAGQERRATGRQFGQWAAFTAMFGFFVWLSHQVALIIQSGGDSPLVAATAALAPLWQAGFIASGIFAAVALACRRRPLARSRPGTP